MNMLSRLSTHIWYILHQSASVCMCFELGVFLLHLNFVGKMPVTSVPLKISVPFSVGKDLSICLVAGHVVCSLPFGSTDG
jgi:hypothetical protein